MTAPTLAQQLEEIIVLRLQQSTKPSYRTDYFVLYPVSTIIHCDAVSGGWGGGGVGRGPGVVEIRDNYKVIDTYR